MKMALQTNANKCKVTKNKWQTDRLCANPILDTVGLYCSYVKFVSFPPVTTNNGTCYYQLSSKYGAVNTNMEATIVPIKILHYTMRSKIS